MAAGQDSPVPSRRVLIVEDHPDSRQSLQMILEMYGYQVEVAEDGQQGLHKALSWNPEVAIVDIGLPLLNGYQVARHVREALRDRIFLIALTAYNKPEDRDRALSQGFDVHLPKPADMEQLLRIIEGWRSN